MHGPKAIIQELPVLSLISAIVVALLIVNILFAIIRNFANGDNTAGVIGVIAIGIIATVAYIL